MPGKIPDGPGTIRGPVSLIIAVDHDTLSCDPLRSMRVLQFQPIRRICPHGQIRRPNSWGRMRLSARRLRATPVFGAILSLLTLGMVLPPTTRASCSDHYVSSRSRSNGELAQFEVLGRSGAIPAPWDESSHERPTPCSGALCSGNAAPPPSTLPSILAPGAGQWAIPAFPISLAAAPDALACLQDGADLRPVDRSCSIFHPPRHLASFLIA